MEPFILSPLPPSSYPLSFTLPFPSFPFHTPTNQTSLHPLKSYTSAPHSRQPIMNIPFLLSSTTTTADRIHEFKHEERDDRLSQKRRQIIGNEGSWAMNDDYAEHYEKKRGRGGGCCHYQRSARETRTTRS